MRILAVDDSPAALTMLKHTLTSAGHSVSTCNNAEQALEMLKDGGPRLVISDWQMPGMTGTELCHAVRREDLSGYVYFILLTSHSTLAERVKGLTAGADDFITKPFEPDELLARVGCAERVLAMETRDVAIFAMAKLAESRDLETGMHLERVQRYARVLAQDLSAQAKFQPVVTPEYTRLIYKTSPLHDIGKVGIPDCVLLKPGRLSEPEFAVMKTHTTIGGQTLDAALHNFPNVTFLEMARDIAVSHHERFDGKGYPAGLKGEAIPLSGRIVAVADVYDALTSRRVYKNAFGHEIARGLLCEGSGTQFDPDIIDAFMRNEEQFLAIRAYLNGPGQQNQNAA